MAEDALKQLQCLVHVQERQLELFVQLLNNKLRHLPQLSQRLNNNRNVLVHKLEIVRQHTLLKFIQEFISHLLIKQHNLSQHNTNLVRRQFVLILQQVNLKFFDRLLYPIVV